MSGHRQIVEICSTCTDPVSVEVCNIPSLQTCNVPAGVGNIYGANTALTVTSWTLEASGTPTTILYTFPTSAAADVFESYVDAANGYASATNTVAVIAFTAPVSLLPIPPAWNVAGVSFERASATTVRVTWSPVAFAESWASGLVSGPMMSNWLTSLTSAVNEGAVTVFPASNTFTVNAYSPVFTQVSTLPVSLPCGVEVTNAEELADSIARAVAGQSSAATGPTVDIETVVLCDATTSFLRVSTYTSGALTSVVDRNLANTAAYTPVGVVGPCDDIDIAREQVCYQASIGAATTQVVRVSTYRDGALLAVAYIDPVTGAAVAAPAAGSIFVECPERRGVSAMSSTRSAFGANAAVTIGATGVPANARSVTVYNDTAAFVAFTISSHGTHQIPPRVSHTVTLFDGAAGTSSAPFSGTWSVATAQGNAGPIVNGINPSVAVDWLTLS